MGKLLVGIGIPLLIVAGCGLLWVAIDIAGGISGPFTAESTRLFVRALLAAVTGFGLVCIAHALYVRSWRDRS